VFYPSSKSPLILAISDHSCLADRLVS